MSDFPVQAYPLPMLSTLQRCGPVNALRALSSVSQAAFTWPAVNQAVYMPLTNPAKFTVNFAMWLNGSTVASGNMDLGVYTWDGARIFSTGSTAQSGASTPQYVSISPGIVLPPGRYYLALACDNVTGTHALGISNVTTNEGRLGGMLQQLSAFPLPPTATFAQWASTGLPVCGLTQ